MGDSEGREGGRAIEGVEMGQDDGGEYSERNDSGDHIDGKTLEKRGRRRDKVGRTREGS